MRTIKFRGKSINKGEWLFGDLVHDNIGGSYIFPIEAENLYKENAVIPETVGQYTGLQDKNGVEIYEGDIVKTEEIGGYCLKDVGVVRYFEDGCYFGIEAPNYSTKLRFTNEEIKINDGYCTIRFTMEYEVIGNIHDNPELLKGE
jgi:uncharacterized phage protein (TIGR01671 family)